MPAMTDDIMQKFLIQTSLKSRPPIHISPPKRTTFTTITASSASSAANHTSPDTPHTTYNIYRQQPPLLPLSYTFTKAHTHPNFHQQSFGTAIFHLHGSVSFKAITSSPPHSLNPIFQNLDRSCSPPTAAIFFSLPHLHRPQPRLRDPL